MLKQLTQHFRYSPVLLLLTVHGKYSFQFFKANVSQSVVLAAILKVMAIQ